MQESDEIAKKRDELLDPRISSYLNDSANDETMDILNNDSEGGDTSSGNDFLNVVNAAKVQSWQTIQNAREYVAQKAQQEKSNKNQ